jgi:hypothetical protein
VEAFVEAPYELGTYDQMVQDHRGRLWARSRLASYDSVTDTWTVPDIQQVENILGVPTGDIWATARLPPDETDYLLTYSVDDGVSEMHELVFEGGALALDRDGQVWEWERPDGRNCGSDETTSAWVWNPWTMEREVALEGQLRGGIGVADNPTGVTPLDVRTDPRSVVVTFEGCEPEGDSAWRRLDWDATVAAGTTVRFEVQAAARRRGAAERTNVSRALAHRAGVRVLVHSRLTGASVDERVARDTEPGFVLVIRSGRSTPSRRRKATYER